MSELLVRVTDKVNKDFYLNCGCTKRGDVIAVREDGANWGVDEYTLPFWAIVKLPNVSMNAASTFLATELPVDPLHPSKTLQKRIFKLAVDDPTIAALIAADARTLPDPDTVNSGGPGPSIPAVDAIDDLALPALTVAKPAIVDPAVIGVSPNVIG